MSIFYTINRATFFSSKTRSTDRQIISNTLSIHRNDFWKQTIDTIFRDTEGL